MSVREYEDILNAVEGTTAENALNMSWYVAGLNNGLFYVGGAFETNGAPPLACLPSDRVVSTREYIVLIGRELDERPDQWRKDAGMPVARIMLEALRREFPCR